MSNSFFFFLPSAVACCLSSDTQSHTRNLVSLLSMLSCFIGFSQSPRQIISTNFSKIESKIINNWKKKSQLHNTQKKKTKILEVRLVRVVYVFWAVVGCATEWFCTGKTKNYGKALSLSSCNGFSDAPKALRANAKVSASSWRH